MVRPMVVAIIIYLTIISRYIFFTNYFDLLQTKENIKLENFFFKDNDNKNYYYGSLVNKWNVLLFTLSGANEIAAAEHTENTWKICEMDMEIGPCLFTNEECMHDFYGKFNFS